MGPNCGDRKADIEDVGPANVNRVVAVVKIDEVLKVKMMEDEGSSIPRGNEGSENRTR